MKISEEKAQKYLKKSYEYPEFSFDDILIKYKNKYYKGYYSHGYCLWKINNRKLFLKDNQIQGWLYLSEIIK